MKRKWLLLIIIMIAVAGCGSDVAPTLISTVEAPPVLSITPTETPACFVQSFNFLFEISRIGNDRPRPSIFTEVDKYEEIDGLEAALEELKKVKAPHCAQDVKTYLIDWYEASIVSKKVAIVFGEKSDEFISADKAAIEPLAAYIESRERVKNDIAVGE